MMEIVNGGVQSGDSFPTTHGNTWGLMALWNHILILTFGWDLIAEERKFYMGLGYDLPIRFKFCGDDTLFTGPKFILEHIRDVVIPQFFITDAQQMHGSGTVLRDIFLAPMH